MKKNEEAKISIKEVWRDIIDYEDIAQVSSLGRIRTKDRMVRGKNNCKRKCKSRILVIRKRENDYNRIKLGTYIPTMLLHRVVAIAFLPNPKNKKDVNHKDGDKSNNTIENLEWVSRSENQKHAYRILKRKVSNVDKAGILSPCSEPIIVSYNNEIIDILGSKSEVFRKYKIAIPLITRYINGDYKRNTTVKDGYTFKKITKEEYYTINNKYEKR